MNSMFTQLVLSVNIRVEHDSISQREERKNNIETSMSQMNGVKR